VLSRGVVTVGETPGADVEQAKLYTGSERKELNMVFQFEHMDLDSGPGGKWDLRPLKLKDLRDNFTKWQKGLEGEGWNSLYLNNHDQPRMVSRFGNDGKYRVESAKMLATFLHTLQGTPYIYQGEEIGMTNVKFDSIEEYKDIETLNMYKEKVEENNENEAKVMESIYVKGRDNARTPVQWDASEHAGFTIGTPWIAVNPNYKEVNVEQAVADPDSIFHYYKKLIKLRKENDVIVYGTYDVLHADHEQIYAYTRTLKKEKLLVLLNFSDHRPEFRLPEDMICRDVEVLISNYVQPEEPDVSSIKLRPYEAVVYKYR